MKTYDGACPVCHAATELVAEFFSAGIYTTRTGAPADHCYPAIPCPGTHTVREVLACNGFPIRADDPRAGILLTVSGARIAG